MTPLAEVAIDAGISVVGSDLKKTLQSSELENRGVQIFYQQDIETIANVHAQNPIDWFVYTSALPDDAPELLFARDNNIRVSKRDDFLSEFIRDKKLRLIAVAGTHGKTTTSAMLVWAFKELGLPISYCIGSTISFGNSGEFDPKSEFFVYEADEYDRNFLKFEPEMALVVSLDYDHADIYPTPDSYNDAFRKFISQSRSTIMWKDAAARLKLSASREITVLYEEVDRKKINLAGSKIRENAFLAMRVLLKILPNADKSKIRRILSEFPGTSRRFEKLSENLYTDYAHHPAEIEATVKKALEMKPKVAVVYQPHQNLRQHEIQKDGGYGDSFSGADKIFWTPTYLVRGDLIEGALAVLNPDDLISGLDKKSRKNAVSVKLDDGLWAKITELKNDNYLVIIMGAGPIDDWARSLVTQ